MQKLTKYLSHPIVYECLQSPINDMRRYFTDLEHIRVLISRHSDFSEEIEEKIESKSLLSIVDYILVKIVSYVDKEILPTSPKVIIQERYKLRFQLPQKFSSPSHVVNKILRQITSSSVSLNSEEADQVMQMNQAALAAAAGYRWVTKAILMLASFALLYGDFWHFSPQLDDPNAEVIGRLKGSKDMKKIIGSDPNKRYSLELLQILIKHVLVLARYLFQLDQLCQEHQAEELAKGILDKIPTWSCQAILVVLATTIQFIKFISSEDRWEWELSNISSDVQRQVRALELELEDLENLEFKAMHIL